MAASRAGAVTKAAQAGDRLGELKAMRERLARAIDDRATPARDLASLTRRLIDVSREVEAMEKAAEEEARERSDAGTPDEAWDATAI